MKVDIDWVRGEHDFYEVTQRCPRQALLAFVTAHGVSVNDVPLPSEISIEDGQVTFEVVIRDEQGRIVVDEPTLSEKRKQVTVPQCAPWPLEPVDPKPQPHLLGCAYPHGGLECSCLSGEVG